MSKEEDECHNHGLHFRKNVRSGVIRRDINVSSERYSTLVPGTGTMYFPRCSRKYGIRYEKMYSKHDDEERRKPTEREASTLY